MRGRGKRSGKLHENQLVLVKPGMGRNPSSTLMYEVVHLLGIGPDQRQNGRCTITFRVDTQAGDQLDLRPRGTTAVPTTTNNLHPMSHHTYHTLLDHQIHILTLMRSGPRQQDVTVSPDITLQIQATKTLFLLVLGDDLK